MHYQARTTYTIKFTCLDLWEEVSAFVLALKKNKGSALWPQRVKRKVKWNQRGKCLQVKAAVWTVYVWKYQMFTFIGLSMSPPQSDCSGIRKGFHVGFKLLFTTWEHSHKHHTHLNQMYKRMFCLFAVRNVNVIKHWWADQWQSGSSLLLEPGLIQSAAGLLVWSHDPLLLLLSHACTWLQLFSSVRWRNSLLLNLTAVLQQGLADLQLIFT